MKKKLHVLFLSSWYPSNGDDSNGIFIKRHAEAIANFNEVSVIHAQGSYQVNQTTVDQHTVNGVNTLVISFKKHPIQAINFFRKMTAIKKGIALIAPFDMVHGNVIFPIGPFAWLISIKHRVPLLIAEHWTDFRFPQNKSIGWIKKRIAKFIVKKARCITVVSKSLGEDMRKFGLKGNYATIGNVVDTQLWKPNIDIEKKNDFIHVSNLSNIQKNITGILDVLEKITKEKTAFKFKFIVTSKKDWLLGQIKKRSIPSNCIVVEEGKTAKELVKEFQGSKCYVSFSNYETFGLAPLEALASGCRVITTPVGCFENISSNAIQKINIGDQTNLYNALISELKFKVNSQLQNIYVVENFSPAIIGKKYTELYQRILNLS